MSGGIRNPGELVRTRALKDERVERIVGMMRSLTWVRGKSNHELADAWGIPLGTVNGLAAVASRVVRAEVRDPDAVTDTVCVRLDRVVRTGEDKDAVRAADVWSRITGARAPERVEHGVAPMSPEGFDALPLEGKIAWLDDRIGALQELRSQLLEDSSVTVDE